MHIHRVLTTAILLVACTPKPADTDGEASSSAVETDGAEATSATVSATGTATTTGVDPTGPQTASSATDEPINSSSGSGPGTSTGTDITAGTSTGTSTTASTESSDDTGGGGLPEACAAACAHWDTCAPGSVGPLEQCTESCSDITEGLPDCAAALADQWSCVAGLSCEEALKFTQGTPTSCLAEIGAADLACEDLGCGGEIGGDMETCELMQECNGQKQQYVCEGEQCTCILNDVPGKQCPAEEFCASGFEAQRAAITACCGWTWDI